MKLNEIPQAIERFTQDQLAARERRLADPALQRQLERTKQLLVQDLKNVCGNGLMAGWRFTLGAPLSAGWEGLKETGSVLSHNFATKNPKKKRSYMEVPSAAIAELITQYAKGAIDIAKLVGNLSILLGRGSVLAARHTIGK